MRDKPNYASKPHHLVLWTVGLFICLLLIWATEIFTVLKHIIEPREEPVDCTHFKTRANDIGHDHYKSIILSKEQIWAKKYFHQRQMQQQIVTMDKTGRAFFQRNWEPSYTCTALARMGCPGDGGKWVCDPQHYLRNDECIIYSFGSNDEFSFEEAIHDFNTKCEIFTFDPTVSNPTNKPGFVKYRPWGLGSQDSVDESIFTLPTIMRRLGHRNITVLKVDCEGCELDSFNTPSFPARKGAIHQILVEVHFDGRPDRIHNFFNFLSGSGYAIVSKEPNIQYSNGNAVEFSLLYLGDPSEAHYHH
jgi:hypothetical protein